VGRLYFLSSEQVSESSNQGLNDQVQLDLHSLQPPAPGNGDYAWLLSDKAQGDTTVLLLGKLSINQGSAHLFYGGDQQHTNLLAITSRFLITEESAATTPIAPSPDYSTWRYYGMIPQSPDSQDPNHFSLLDHLRHLLAADPLLDQLELPGGLCNWFYRNTGKLIEWTVSARDRWELHFTAMNELRAAVIGVGRLGAIHARKYAAIPNLKLTHVVDTDAERAAEIARELGAIAFEDHRQLPGAIDLASVAAPGVYHHAIASDLMRAGIDVLLEKPMAEKLTQARDLAALASASKRVLQIGHLERFNPAVVHLHSIVKNPRFVECHRLAPFTERGTDVDVVLDLMVHDLDVILSVTAAEVVSLEAVGVPILTERIDVANARIRFSDGLIANLNTSRVAPRRERGGAVRIRPMTSKIPEETVNVA